MDSVPSTAHRPPLRLAHVMAGVAVTALILAAFPNVLGLSMAVTVFGILILQGMRLPLVTRGNGIRRWLPWAAWGMLLAACPAAMVVVGIAFPHVGQPAYVGPRPWAANVVDGLCAAHLGASVIASISVVLLAEGGSRWFAWAGVLAMGVVAAFAALGAGMATTGVSL